MTEKEYLLAKADGVDDVLKWARKKNKELKRYYSFEVPLDILIGIEKYKKKLKHEALEAEQIEPTKSGNWIGGYKKENGIFFYEKPCCPFCNKIDTMPYNYCKHCGAKLEW